MTCPTVMAFGEISGFAACRSSRGTRNFSAIWLIVSPDCTVYVKGVGLGRGVVNGTRPSGVGSGLSDEVAYGVRLIAGGRESVLRGVQAVKIIKSKTRFRRTG